MNPIGPTVALVSVTTTRRSDGSTERRIEEAAEMAPKRPVGALDRRGTDPVFVRSARNHNLLLSFQARRSAA